MKHWRIVQHIFEADERDPTLVHVFYGETAERAAQVYEAHMQTDSFMRACTARERFRDFACHAVSHTECFLGGEWVAVSPTRIA